MKNCGFFCSGWWPFLVFPLLLLLLFSFFQWRAVEEDVRGNALQTIDQQGQAWAQAETYNRGRDVLVDGLAPDQNSRDLLEQNLLSTEGVRTVNFTGGIAIAEPEVAAAVPEVAVVPLRNSSVTLNWQNDQVILQGEVSSQATIDRIVANAELAYGSNRVINQLRLSGDVSDIQIDDDLFNSSAILSNGSQIMIEGDQVTLSGDVDSEQVKLQIGDAISQSFDGQIINNLNVVLSASQTCESTLNELLQTSKIEFATSSASISAASDTVLAAIVDISKGCAEAQFEVAGHTDSTGNYDSNVLLSQQRAQAVVTRLIEMQLDQNRFTARGFGPDQPIGDNQTAAGRAQNRRIEFNLTN